MEIEGTPFVTLLHQTGGVPVVKASGEVDLLTAGRFKETLLRAVGDVRADRPGVVIVDLSGVGFIDSCGVAALASATREFRNAGGRVHIVTKDSPVARTLGITGLFRLFDVFPSVSSAAGRGVA
ncbi:STAS domain-containing protein [Rubrobacter indicoceani]|uniref:STAS domain-containing protein n=1 Tax=Rubrobacter indicoceani TaxID=2051957 RepID=UPI000E5B8831|nr:STAS domain-containing protein [Rubrobacter indicoceani]